MNPVMYIILNKGAGMSTGKAAAQAAHAAVVSYDFSKDEVVKAWWEGKHYAKVVLEVPDAQALLVAERYIASRGFDCELIIDEGRTEVDAMTPTALAIEIVDKDKPHVRKTFGEYKLYKDVPDGWIGAPPAWPRPPYSIPVADDRPDLAPKVT